MIMSVAISFAVSCFCDSVSINNPKFDLNHANYDGMRESLQSVDWHKKFLLCMLLMLGTIFLMFLTISSSAISPCFVPAPRKIFT